MKNFAEKHFPWIFLLFLAILMIVLAFVSPGYYGGADNINHYFISRYAFIYPHLFLDPWGRPLFNILSSPFAAFGFTAFKLFNVSLGIATAWLCYLIARRLAISFPYMVIVLVIFMPLYCIMMLTGLTEILFGFVLVLALYLFFRESFIASAIVVSFLPFARSEGIIILPFFFLAYFFRKKYLPVPFLLTGFLFLSIIGSFYYKDFFWIYTHNPYPLHHPIYKEKGPLLHFILNIDKMTGLPLLILLITGIIDLVARLFRGEKENRRIAFYGTWMIFFPFAAYFLFHSFLYWKALGGSMGLIRVIAGVLPLAALMSVMGYQYIAEKVLVNRFQRVVLFFGTLILVAFENFSVYRYPVPAGQEESLIRETAAWLKDSKNDGKLVFYNDLNVPFYLGIDPFDHTRVVQKWFASDLAAIPDSSVYIWDAHFGPNECRVPLDSVMRTPGIELIKIVRPDMPFTTLKNYNYEIYVFRRVSRGEPTDNYAFKDSLAAIEDRQYKTGFSRYCDFETNCTTFLPSALSTKEAHSGTHSYLMNGNSEFSPGFFLKFSDISASHANVRVRAEVFVYPLTGFRENPADFVISLEDRDGPYGYYSSPLENLDLKEGQWNPVTLHASLPEIRSGKDDVKIYIWHRGKKSFYMDDISVQFLFREKK